ncbi:MAG: AAA family ATPase [Nitrososphaerales archaeon]
MILRELTLQNFRSYGENPTHIELDRGVTLFEGDIGSGKSSILYAIEFALFGLGELEAKYILRSSANISKVELAFTVGTEEYRVTRTIERKGSKTIQTRGWMQEGQGRVIELSPTELRSRILTILNFKEKQGTKSSSRIYRYAIFTPQELMKEVLSQKSEERIDTLRRAFGVEDYSFANSNTEIVLKEIDKQIEIYTKLSENLPERKVLLQETQRELLANKTKLKAEESMLAQREKRLKEAALLQGELEAETKRIIQLQASIPILERNLSQLQFQLFEGKSDLQRFQKAQNEIEVTERKIPLLKQDYDKYLALREKLRELDHLAVDIRNLEKEISRLKDQILSKEASLKAELEYGQSRLKKIQLKIEEYQSEISRAKTLESSATALKEKASLLTNFQNKVEVLHSDIGSTLGLIQAKQLAIEEVRAKAKAVDGISKQSKCPLCGQSLTPDHLKRVESEYQLVLRNLQEEKRSFEKKLEEQNLELNLLEKERDESRRAQKDLERLEQDLARINQLRGLESSLGKELIDLQSSAQRLHATILNREFATDLEKSLSEELTKKDLLSHALLDYEKLRDTYQKLEDSGVIEAYQSALSVVSKRNEVNESLQRIQKRLEELEKSITKSSIEINGKKIELEQSEPMMLQYTKVKDEVKILDDECSLLRGNFGILIERVKNQEKEEKDLAREVSDLENNSSRASRSKGVSSWLSDTFLPAVSEIERYVLASINEEFAHIFERIFSVLVEGDLSVRIDDHFAPLVEQAGYELDVQSLSGGERTAVALAYRLALNYMVRRSNSAMQTNLLILDEPTEGFSKEQIYRFRNALEELANDQVIIVSHERDLEPMAERTYRVEKENGESLTRLLG